MANDITKSPWLVDTVGVVTAQPLTINSIEWVSKLAVAGDQCILKDAAGRLIFEAVAAGPNYDERAYDRGTDVFSGLTVDTLSSGRVYVRVKTKFAPG